MFVFSFFSITVVVAETALGRIGAVSLARFSLDQPRGGCRGRVEARTFYRINASVSTHAMIIALRVWQARVLDCWRPSAANLTRTLAK